MLALAPLVALVAVAGREPLPVLTHAPAVDGRLGDVSPSKRFTLPASAKGPSGELSLKGAFREDTLYLGITVMDDHVVAGDRLDLSLYFPNSGLTSRGVVYRFGPEGARAPIPDLGPAGWTQALVRSATKRDGRGFSLEVAIPARSLPRFPAFGPLLLSVCAEYADVDGESAEPSLLSSCQSQDMPGGPVRLPDGLRKALGLVPISDVEGLEARERGWLGFSRLHFPAWVRGDVDLTPASLIELVAGDEAVEPASVAIPLPDRLRLADGRPIFLVLSGANPFGSPEGCADSSELRTAFFVIERRTAVRVLEWPVATCRLGRAMRFELSPDGGLTISYTGGSTARFTWTGDRFERSEVG
jgi:hypothetical protein